MLYILSLLLLFSCSRSVSINEELNQLVLQDRMARAYHHVDLSRDEERLKRVQQIEESRGLRHALDFYNAALIYQHGKQSIDYLKAYNLSKRAAQLDPNLHKALWLSCASEDRYLLKIGKAQVWGTQYKLVNGRQIIIEPFHKWAKTDQERRECGFSI